MTQLPQGPWIYIHDLNPWVFQWAGHSLSWYWLCYILGYLFLFFFSLSLVKKFRVLTPYAMASYMQWALPCTLLSARLFYVLFYYPSFFWENPILIPQFWRGGMSFHGALIGPIALAYFLGRKREHSPWHYLDVTALGAPLVLFFGRISNFINGELAGHPTSGEWGVVFPQLYDLQPRHPSQLYQALGEGMILFFILWFQRGKLVQPGRISSLFLIFYAILRFISEFWREPDPQVGELVGINLGQWLCLGMLIAGFVAYYSSFKTRYSASKTSP